MCELRRRVRMQKNPDSVNESPTIKENDKPSSEGIGMDSNKKQETKYYRYAWDQAQESELKFISRYGIRQPQPTSHLYKFRTSKILKNSKLQQTWESFHVSKFFFYIPILLKL